MTQIDKDQPDVDTLSGRPRVVVIGGGLAGLSAAAALVESGFDVQLLNQGGIVVGERLRLRILRMEVLSMPASMSQWAVRTFLISLNVQGLGLNYDVIGRFGSSALTGPGQPARQPDGCLHRSILFHCYLGCLTFLYMEKVITCLRYDATGGASKFHNR